MGNVEQKPAEGLTVRCALCEKEIPKEIARSNNDVDYPLYFCSSTCHEQLADDQQALKIQDAGEPA